MSNIRILKILGLVAALGTLASLYVLYWNIGSGVQKFFCFALLSFLVGFIIYFPAVGYSAKTVSGSLAKVGTAVTIGFVALILSIFSMIAFVNDHAVISGALDIFAVVLIIFSVGASLITSQHVDAITEFKDYSSDHTAWASTLSSISNVCAEKDLKEKIARLADNMTYLARDPSSEKLSINLQITEIIKTLSKNVMAVNRLDIELNLSEISSLVAERESELKQKRSQV